jgi:hypothetical protein
MLPFHPNKMEIFGILAERKKQKGVLGRMIFSSGGRDLQHFLGNESQ